MNRLKTLTGVLAVSTLASSFILTAVPAEAAAAPTCLAVTISRSGVWPKATIKNNCTSSKRVKVLWAYAPDSACMTIAAGKTGSHSTGVLGRFDGLETC